MDVRRWADLTGPRFRALLGIGVAILVLWALGAAVLLVFASLLVATFLTVAGEWTARRLSLSYGIGLAIACTVIALAIVGIAMAVAPALANQVSVVATGVPPALARLFDQFGQTALGRLLLGGLGSGHGAGSTLIKPLLSSVDSVVTALGSVVFVIFMGVYLAAAPRIYLEGALRLVPPGRRARTREILVAAGGTLKMFLFGRLFSMAVIVVCSIVGLWELGVSAPAALGLISGALSFVPYIGSAAGAVAPGLLAYMKSPTLLLYVLGLYLAIHLLDGYILVPLVQRRATHLMPALTLAAQLALGLLWGILGIAVATPLVAVLLTVVRMAYVEDVLESGRHAAAEKTKA